MLRLNAATALGLLRCRFGKTSRCAFWEVSAHCNGSNCKFTNQSEPGLLCRCSTQSLFISNVLADKPFLAFIIELPQVFPSNIRTFNQSALTADSFDFLFGEDNVSPMHLSLSKTSELKLLITTRKTWSNPIGVARKSVARPLLQNGTFANFGAWNCLATAAAVFVSSGSQSHSGLWWVPVIPVLTSNVGSFLRIPDSNATVLTLQVEDDTRSLPPSSKWTAWQAASAQQAWLRLRATILRISLAHWQLHCYSVATTHVDTLFTGLSDPKRTLQLSRSFKCDKEMRTKDVSRFHFMSLKKCLYEVLRHLPSFQAKEISDPSTWCWL